MKMRLVIRGFAPDHVLVFEDRVEIPEDQFDRFVGDLAQHHAQALVDHQFHMIEIEFLDEPNRDKRFFRFGTDPRMMVKPAAVEDVK